MLKKFITWLNQNLLHYSSVGAYWEPIIQVFKPNWREGYYRAQVKSIDSLLKDTLAIDLEVGASWPCHTAGQHLELTIEIDGKLVTRVFTIASSPSDITAKKQLRLVIKCQPNGLQTAKLSTLAIDTWVNISAPYGDFYLKQHSKPCLLLAAGSGITPFIAMLSALKSSADTEQSIHLIYYAKPEEHLLIDELAELATGFPYFTYELMHRAVNGDVYQQLDRFEKHAIYVCGPTAFYQGVAKFAQEYNSELHAEHFSLTPVQHSDKQAFAVSLNGKALTINNSTAILTQLLQQGEPMTYGCKMGICHQCQCTKKSGVVKNIRTGALSDRGEELIQLCVSQIITDLELEA